MRVWCHGTPRPLRPHAPDHLRPSPTPSAYTPVSLQCTLRKLAQPRHSCHQTKLGSMSNFPGLCPYVSGHCLFVFFLHMPHLPDAFSLMIMGNHALLV